MSSAEANSNSMNLMSVDGIGGSQPSTPIASSHSHPTDSSSGAIGNYHPSAAQTVTESQSDQANEAIDVDGEEERVGLGPLGTKRKLTSVVWEHFEEKSFGTEVKAVCSYCKKKLSADPKNGTRHLHEHLKRCPRRRVMDIRQKVLTTNHTKEGKVQVNSYTFDQEIARRELACMVVLHEHPLAIVEHYGFKRFVHSLQPLFKIPSRYTIRRDILKIYDLEKVNTMKLLERLQSRVAMTTDMWTASNQKKGYMAVTGHFIDDSWTLQSRILRFVYVPCSHTKEVLCEALKETLLDWNIDRKLSTITVDNCSTNDAMIELLLDKLESNSSSLLLGGTLLHMRCCAHILNLIVKDGLDVIKRGIEKIRESVVYWRGTPKREEKFEETVRQLRIPLTKKLVLDCSTRWNSTFLMLQTALLYKDVFVRLKQRDSQYKTLPSEEEWEHARDICERLKIFYEVTELFSGTQFPTANLYFPKLCDIRVALSEWLLCRNETVRKMAQSMIEKYDKYWLVIHGIMGVAAVLDPRYKLALLEYYFPLLYGNQGSSEREIERVRQLCYDLINEYQFRQCSENENHFGSASSSFGSSQSGDSSRMSGFDQFVLTKKKNITVKSELDHYLEEDVLPRSEHFDILSWWKTNGLRYPTLQRVARDILAIPVSTVASESAFSTSGRLVSPHRNRLHENTLEALMCTQNWLSAIEHGSNEGNPYSFASIFDPEEDIDEDKVGGE